MKRIILLITLFTTIFSCKKEGVFFDNAFVIEDINLIDPIDGLKENRSVVIRGNKIIKTFKTNEVEISSENKIYPGKGKFLIPGLWDFHVHFSFERNFAEAMPNLFLAHGITSVRDTGGEIDFVNPYKKTALEHPKTKSRVKIAGPLIDGKYNVYDGNSPYFPVLSIQNKDVSQLEKNVAYLVEQKVDFLKAYEMLSPEQFKTLAQIAKKNNLKLTGHVPLSMNVIEASNLGLSSIEHLRNIELSMTYQSDALFEERRELLKNKNQIKGSALRSMLHKKQRMKSVYDLDSTKINQVVDVLAKNNTWQIPTLALYINFAFKKFKTPEYLSLLDVLPKSKKEEWIEKINASDASVDQQTIDYTAWSSGMVNYMHKKGIPFLAGTDTPIGFLVPGLSLHHELEEFKKSGLSELEILQTATINPAKYFDLQDSLGRIKSNYVADLIILDKNPLQDIANTKSIRAVIKDGNYMNRSYLDSLLKQ